MNKLLKPALGALTMLTLLAGVTTPAFADHGDDGYRGRGYDAPRYQNYDRGDRGNWGDRGDWGRDHEYRHHRGYDREVYYAAPYYAPARVIYAQPAPRVYYPGTPYRSGVEVRFQQMF